MVKFCRLAFCVELNDSLFDFFARYFLRLKWFENPNNFVFHKNNN